MCALGWVLGVGAVALDARPAPAPAWAATISVKEIAAIERARLLPAAEGLLREQPVTVTASRSPRSAGGPHDFFSEGDYWWFVTEESGSTRRCRPQPGSDSAWPIRISSIVAPPKAGCRKPRAA
jgi:hypothetical protein